MELRLIKSLAEQKEKVDSLLAKVTKVDSQVDSLNNVLSTMGGAGGNGVDPHKLCHMDGELRRLRDSNRSNELKVQSLEDELKLKLITF